MVTDADMRDGSQKTKQIYPSLTHKSVVSLSCTGKGYFRNNKANVLSYEPLHEDIGFEKPMF